MQNLDIDLTLTKALFVSVQDDPYVIIEISDEAALELRRILPTPFRQLYVSDDELDRVHLSSQIPKNELVRLKLPDPGSTMSGDFGEMLTAVMQGALAHPLEVIDPKKWRYKQDRIAPAPKSDVVQFILPAWPDSSDQDRLICSEVKAKALKGTSNPVTSAIEHSKKDQDGRLALTLSWLRERAIFHEENEMALQLSRFIKADSHPEAAYEYRAVAVISADLVPDETSAITKEIIGDAVLIVVSVPNMKKTYSEVFDAIAETVAPVSGDTLEKSVV
ncbi:Hachiman antiphage defense system protein HamA [Plantibacter sp. Mn2098]|uniref:Hachiman antiphage defense system protein HamA n=1 Tax=Plantibacter sp. Mn2098 TaxID=3395266 RepID=UPI003BE1DACD